MMMEPHDEPQSKRIKGDQVQVWIKINMGRALLMALPGETVESIVVDVRKDYHVGKQDITVMYKGNSIEGNANIPSTDEKYPLHLIIELCKHVTYVLILKFADHTHKLKGVKICYLSYISLHSVEGHRGEVIS